MVTTVVELSDHPICSGTNGWPELAARKAVMSRKPISVQVIEEGSVRIVVRTYNDGKITRTPVDPTKKPTRKPRLRVQRLGVKNYTRKKQI